MSGPITPDVLSLLHTFLNPVAFQWPVKETCGTRLYKNVHGNHSKLYTKHVQDLSNLCVKKVAVVYFYSKLCKESIRMSQNTLLLCALCAYSTIVQTCAL